MKFKMKRGLEMQVLKITENFLEKLKQVLLKIMVIILVMKVRCT